MTVNARNKAEIEEQRNQKYETRRITVPALEEILYKEFPVLDHGFIRVIDYMGGDSSIVQAARVSYGKGTKKISEDKGLIRYLYRHQHTTPFEMCEIKLHVKLPIFVARQWIRHRTANVNEYSARYSILSPDYYVPKPEHCAMQSKTNRQGRSAVFSPKNAEEVREKIVQQSEKSYKLYIDLLNETDAGETIDPAKDGLARELARMVVPVNFYTEWYWKIDLHNLLRLLSLRADSHAQYEIQAYANIILHDVVQKWVPTAYKAFVDYDHRVNGVHLSAQEASIVRRIFGGDKVTQETSELGAREWDEFKKKF